MSDITVSDQVLGIANQLAASGPDAISRAGAQAVVERLGGPLRVAIAGRVKAGKSTLLNALVGERLAPTDAGECTRIVSAYRQGPRYQVTAKLRGGGEQELSFGRSQGALDIHLGGLNESAVDSLDIAWPTSALSTITLIDTPGLASLNDANSRRTREFLENDGDTPSDADAVIYLMRHAHSSDIAFLDAFMDRTVTAASPVNAVAVLSRADEIGAGRPDAMESASRIATRYQADPQLRGLCATVVPLAGLLAETGLTLREDEVSSLRLLAATNADELAQMLMSADQFCEVSSSELTVEIRRGLLDRLGLFGVRVAVLDIQSGQATTAATLGPLLVARSGLDDLRRLIAGHFMPRARVLQARSGLVALRAIAREIATVDAELAASLDRQLEQIEAGAVQFAQIRGAHLVGSGIVNVSAAERAELDDLFAGRMPGTAAVALEGIRNWRRRGADPLADPPTVEVCEIAARSYERAYGILTPS